MRFYNDNYKVKRGDELLTGVTEAKPFDMTQGPIYDVAQMLHIQEKWSWIGTSLIYENEPNGFAVIMNGEQISYSSQFTGRAVVTVNFYPAEKRIYIAVEKPDGGADFDSGLHELVILSFQLVGYRLYIDIRERP